MNFILLWNSNSNSFWHFKLFKPALKPCFLNVFSFKIHMVVGFDILNHQVFILTLKWTKDLHLIFSFFCLLKNPRFWISFSLESQTVITFCISNCKVNMKSELYIQALGPGCFTRFENSENRSSPGCFTSTGNASSIIMGSHNYLTWY